MSCLKYILIFSILFNYFSDSYNSIIEQIETHSNKKILRPKEFNNLSCILQNIRNYDENISLLENDLKELKTVLSKYIVKCNDENKVLFDSFAKIFYISRYLKYGIPTDKENYIRYMIVLKCVLKYYIEQLKDTSEKIRFLKRLKDDLSDKISYIKKCYNRLVVKKNNLMLKKNTALNYEKISRINSIEQNVSNMDELINELEIEEYIGVLKDISKEYVFKSKVSFAYPCKYLNKKFEKFALHFFVNPASKIYAPEDGVVVFLGKFQNKKVIVIKHNKSLKSILYGDIVNFIKVGEIVRKNQEIAQITDSINDINVFELRIIKDGNFENPIKYFKN